ncbi:MAG TPA: histidine phosphatase family protein [Myxococcota bacterium]|nr:histidine phosphatase family protein [Myxococcota bacterium]
MAEDAAATLVLVRHGEIPANAARVWHGSTDSELTELGRAQAERTALHLAGRAPRPAALYTSPLARTRETARSIARQLALEPVVEPGLAEYGIGELEGESYEDLVRVHRFFARIARDPEFAPPGGESPSQVIARMSAVLARLAREHRGEQVVVVSHGAALGLTLGALLDRDANQWQRYHLSNCAVSELVLEPAPRLLSWNRTEHL